MTKKFFQLHIMPNTRLTFDLSNRDDIKRAIKIVNINNGKTSIYRTVYNFLGEVSRENAVIDKIYLDFDPDDAGKGVFSNVRKLCDYLRENNIRHSIYYSGRGVHVYLYTELRLASDFKNAKIAIRNYVKELVDTLDLVIDWSVVGDIRRISRLPNSINTKTGFYCIPLKNIQLSRKEAEQLAVKPQYYSSLVKGECIDLKPYDTEPTFEYKIEQRDIFLEEDVSDKVPLCIQEMLKRGNCNYRERFFIIVALKELAYSQADVENIIWKYLNVKKSNGSTYAEHCILEEDQVTRLFERDDFFPSCDVIRAEGYCLDGCRGQEIYI